MAGEVVVVAEGAVAFGAGDGHCVGKGYGWRVAREETRVDETNRDRDKYG